MGVEGSCGVVERFLKYVSNYNRELCGTLGRGKKKKRKTGLAVLCCFVVIRNRMRRCNGGARRDEKKRGGRWVRKKKENTLNEENELGTSGWAFFEATEKRRRLIPRGTCCDV